MGETLWRIDGSPFYTAYIHGPTVDGGFGFCSSSFSCLLYATGLCNQPKRRSFLFLDSKRARPGDNHHGWRGFLQTQRVLQHLLEEFGEFGCGRTTIVNGNA